MAFSKMVQRLLFFILFLEIWLNDKETVASSVDREGFRYLFDSITTGETTTENNLDTDDRLNSDVAIFAVVFTFVIIVPVIAALIVLMIHQSREQNNRTEAQGRQNFPTEIHHVEITGRQNLATPLSHAKNQGRENITAKNDANSRQLKLAKQNNDTKIKITQIPDRNKDLDIPGEVSSPFRVINDEIPCRINDVELHSKDSDIEIPCRDNAELSGRVNISSINTDTNMSDRINQEENPSRHKNATQNKDGEVPGRSKLSTQSNHDQISGRHTESTNEELENSSEL